MGKHSTWHEPRYGPEQSHLTRHSSRPNPRSSFCQGRSGDEVQTRFSQTEGLAWIFPLVERLLSTDDFVKYVCNGTPQPIDLASNEKHHNAVFLCFLQHVQYHFTKAKAFVLDYQGTFDSPDSHCQGLSYVRCRLLVDRSAGHGKIRVCQTSFSNRTALILFQSCGTSAFCGWKCWRIHRTLRGTAPLQCLVQVVWTTGIMNHWNDIVDLF